MIGSARPGKTASQNYDGIVDMDRDKLSVSLRLESKDLPQQSVAEASLPASPCIQVCTLNDQQMCIGCRRTIKEIVAWPRLSRSEQAAMLEELTVREL